MSATATKTMAIGEARALIGGLSKPSKMPGHGYGLPAKECSVGSRLRKVEGSTCSGCYALKGRYMFRNVQDAQYKRLKTLTDPSWSDAMVLLIGRTGEHHFRWHDSGDLQGLWHLQLIIDVAIRTPTVTHWLPTREVKLVREYLAEWGPIPGNLCVRVSAHMVDQRPASGLGLPTSTVITSEDSAGATGHVCPAPQQNNTCGDCRACWDTNIPNVAYHVH